MPIIKPAFDTTKRPKLFISYSAVRKPLLCIASTILSSVAAIGCSTAHAVSAYAAAFNGPAGSSGLENTGTLFATALTQADDGHQGMYAKATAEAGELHVVATSYNDTGSFQFATSVARFNDEFTLSHPEAVNQAVVTWVLRLDGSCIATPGATNGRPNATCYSQASLNAGSPWGISLDHSGEVSITATVTILNGFGNPNGFPISPFVQVGGYSTIGTFLADFQNTAHIYAYSSTPGVSLVTASGYDYSLPVPEPSTSALLLFALGIVLLSPKCQRFGLVLRPPRIEA